MRLLSWNVCQGGGKRLPAQIALIAERKLDVVALQEVTKSSRHRYRSALAELGLEHVSDSFDLAPDPKVLIGPRRYGQLIASRWALKPRDPDLFSGLPWKERVLSAEITTPTGSIELHVTHVPPGATNMWTKIEHLEGLYAGLAKSSAIPRVLVGDFNTPKDEHPDGRVETWGCLRRKGLQRDRWDAGEQNVLVGLSKYDLADVFRALHGYGKKEFSIEMKHLETVTRRRFDHVFASASLRASRCEYLHNLRERRLSDHVPVEVDFGARDSSACPEEHSIGA